MWSYLRVTHAILNPWWFREGNPAFYVKQKAMNYKSVQCCCYLFDRSPPTHSGPVMNRVAICQRRDIISCFLICSEMSSILNGAPVKQHIVSLISQIHYTLNKSLDSAHYCSERCGGLYHRSPQIIGWFIWLSCFHFAVITLHRIFVRRSHF